MFGRSKKKGDKPAKAAKKPKKEKKPKASKKPRASKKPKPSGVAIQKRPTDIYTVMLMMSLGFVFLSCIFLTLELGSYDFGFSNLTPWK